MSGVNCSIQGCHVSRRSKYIYIFAEDDRDIYFICDQPHLVKTGRNNLHSGFDKTFSRLLWNDNHYLTWIHIKDLMLVDLVLGLQLCPKIITEHIKLTPFSVMNVHLAAQVLSTSVSVALKEFGQPETAGTAKYCEMFDKFFDCLNVRNTTQNALLERFEWLISTILPYFTNWKNSIESRRGGPYSNTDKARLFISWQTHDHTFINRSYKIPFQVQYVLTERFCPDPLENYFGRQRSMGRHRDNPNKNF